MATMRILLELEGRIMGVDISISKERDLLLPYDFCELYVDPAVFGLLTVNNAEIERCIAELSSSMPEPGDR